MARLLIISRSLALGMRLTDLHEVEERSADELAQNLPKVEATTCWCSTWATRSWP